MERLLQVSSDLLLYCTASALKTEIYANVSISSTDFFILESSPEFARAEVILIWVEDQDGTILMRDNAFLKETPKSIPGLEAHNITIYVSVSQSENDRAVISVESDFLALYVTLTTMAQGRFSENSFHLRPNIEKV